MPGLQKGKKHRAGAGRPPLSASPTVRVTVTLPAPLAARLKALGEGNASLAVRRLLQEAPEL
jgi:predicted nucleic acid-binding Zn ribbon protein